MGPKPKPVAERFWTKVNKDGPTMPNMQTQCWVWTASVHRNRGGYGEFKLAGRRREAHRVAWELEYGPIPDGLLVLHKCDNPPCVRHEHLFLGSDADNVADMIVKGRQASGDRNGSRRHPESVPRGGRHRQAKLNEEQAIEIIRRKKCGQTHAELAKEFGVSRSVISAVGVVIWRHVVGDGQGQGRTAHS
jgi:hypothetical protein